MPDPTRITVKLFGPQAREAAAHELLLSFKAPPSCAEVLGAIGEVCPAISPSLAVSRIAINQSFASASAIVQESDEVALIGLVAGG